jgi:hypothetical protein
MSDEQMHLLFSYYCWLYVFFFESLAVRISYPEISPKLIGYIGISFPEYISFIRQFLRNPFTRLFDALVT